VTIILLLEKIIVLKENKIRLMVWVTIFMVLAILQRATTMISEELETMPKANKTKEKENTIN